MWEPEISLQIAAFLKTRTQRGAFRAKQDGIFCGMTILKRVFALLDGRVVITPLVNDGDKVVSGQALANIEGPSQSILSGERVALNIIQHMSVNCDSNK